MVDFESFASHSKCVSFQMDISFQCQYCTFTIWTERFTVGDTVFSSATQHRKCFIDCFPSLITAVRESGRKASFKYNIYVAIFKRTNQVHMEKCFSTFDELQVDEEALLFIIQDVLK